MVVWRHELGEVENEYISHNFSLCAIFLPKIIKIGGNLTKFWQKQFCTVFFETWCRMFSRPDPLAGGDGLAAPLQELHPRFGHAELRLRPFWSCQLLPNYPATSRCPPMSLNVLSFSQSLSLHSRLSLPRADLLELWPFVVWQSLAVAVLVSAAD